MHENGAIWLVDMIKMNFGRGDIILFGHFLMYMTIGLIALDSRNESACVKYQLLDILADFFYL